MTKTNMIRLLTIFFVINLTGCLACWKVQPQIAYLSSFQFKKCQARCIDIQTLNTLPPKECGADWPKDVIDLPLESCDDVIGFKLETVAKEIRPQSIETLQCYKDSCGGN